MKTGRTRSVVAILGLAVALCGLTFSAASGIKRISGQLRSPAPPVATSVAAPEVVEGLAAVDRALRAGNVGAGMAAWHPTYAAALRDRGWAGLISVADARLRIERAAGFQKAGESKARELYLMALFRARHEGSVAGVIRAAIAFDQLGDRDVAMQAMRIAATLDDSVQVAEALASGQWSGL